MKNQVFLYGKWIVPNKFLKLKPINILHKQCDEKEIDLPDELKIFIF